MAKLSILAGATSQSINLFIQNSTTGAPLTGLAYNTSSLTAYYSFAGANAGSVQIVLATLAAVNSAYSSGGFKEIDSTNMPGVYRLDLPNAVVAASKGRSVTVYLQGAANMAPCVAEMEITGVDNQDGVRFGMSAIPAIPALIGTVVTGTSTTSFTASGLPTGGNLVNAYVQFSGNVTAALKAVCANITTFTAGSTATIGIAQALGSAPATGDTFSVIGTSAT
jgi:hypothetical protein